jgi:hypothetical protein
MLKPTASYRMTQQTKRSLAKEINPVKRAEMKSLMIQAELNSMIRVKDKKTRTESDSSVSE